MDFKEITHSLSIEDVEELAVSLEHPSSLQKNIPKSILLALLGPHLAGPKMGDGWMAADFCMAHKIYGNLPGEQMWMCAVDLEQEVVTEGPYIWGYPRDMRLQVLAAGDAPFYSLSTPQSLLPDFKAKLNEIVSHLQDGDRLLVLIFAHGDTQDDENHPMTGILVGEDDEGNFGVMHAAELNSMLISTPARVTLITSACYGGTWHHRARTTYSATNEYEESLSVPMSNSGAFRGGFFWEALWYELSRLGIKEVGNDVEQSYKFKEGVGRITDRLKTLCQSNPMPHATVASEEFWDHHFREVIQLNENEAQSHLSFVIVQPNPDEGDSGNEMLLSGGTESGQGLFLNGAAKTFGSYVKVDGAHDFSRSEVFGKLKSGSYMFPIYLSRRLQHSRTELSDLVFYFIHSRPGLHNLPSNMEAFLLLRKFNNKTATQKELENLRCILKYRMVQDTKAEEILSFLNIPRICLITRYRAEVYHSEERLPYLQATFAANLFDPAPRVKPPCYTYTKPMQYLASTTLYYKLDLNWWTTSLKGCHDYFGTYTTYP